MKNFIRYINLPLLICDHVFGKNHKPTHRMTVGSIIAVLGVSIAQCGGGFPHIISFFIDFTGYSLHATGLYPILESIAEKKNEE